MGANSIATIPVGANPAFPCYDPADGDIYVPAYGAVLLGGNNVSIISGATNKEIALVLVGDDPIDAVYDAADQDVYIMNFGMSDNLSVMHGTSVIAWVGVGTAPIGGVYDPGNGFLYVSNYQSNNVSILSGTTVMASVNVGMFPTTPVYDPVNGDIYVANLGTDNVSIIKGTSLIATVAVGVNPASGAYDGANGHIYVPNSGSDNVSIIAGTTLVTNVSVGGNTGSNPYSVSYDPGNGLVYVPCTGTATLSIINSTTGNVTNISVGQAPREAVYDPATGYMYVLNLISDNVTMLNGSTIVASIDVGQAPYGGVFDSANSETYVSDYVSNNVTVLGTNLSAYTVTFNETGLPAGATWEAQIGPTAFFSSTPSIVFSQPNGPFNYTIWTIDGYTVNQTGSATVNGANLLINITFRELFEILFHETGLPIGTDWNVSIGPMQNDSLNSTLELFEPNGTYTYSIRPIAGYSTTWTGSENVHGTRVTVNVTFIRVTYSLEFSESGLPTGTPWEVSVGGPPVMSTTSTIGFNEPNGTYRYVVEPVGGYAGNFSSTLTLNGSGAIVPVVFVAVYELTFEETGLPGGTLWSVSIGASENSSTTDSVGFLEPNGSAPYTVSQIAGYTEVGPGQYTIAGAAATVRITFEAVFGVTFQESGLPKGTPWTVLLGSTLNHSTTSTIGFVEPNGSLNYVVEPIPGYSGNGSGQLTVAGSTVPVSVTFVAVYVVTFTESGLPKGTAWSVSIDGFSNGSVASDLGIPLPNGSFSYRVAPLPGFRTIWTGSVTIAGAGKSVAVPFIVNEYVVTFEETGLSAGTSWSATVNGTVKQSTGSNITFEEPNGSYDYSVAQVPGYQGGTAGTVSVQGSAPSSIVAAFQVTKAPVTGFAAVTPPEWAAIGVVVAAATLGSILLLRRRGRTPSPAIESSEPPRQAQPEPPTEPSEPSEP